MAKRLPSRPHLDRLRRDAKSLLAALDKGDPEALQAFRAHLPAARTLTDAQLRAAGYRLADAQSAIARKTGFAHWPALGRHVQQLRALEGAWEFLSLEIEGTPTPAAMSAGSRILIDGDRFRCETPGATYEGIFTIDVEAEPHAIDIAFVEGPEAGNTNLGIFRLDGPDRLTLCLDMNGKARPTEFRTSPASGHALETLQRASAMRLHEVCGGIPPLAPSLAPTATPADFPYAPSNLLDRLQGDWHALQLVLNGQKLPPALCKTARRSALHNELKIWVAGQLIIDALVRIDETALPFHVDYLHLAGEHVGKLQLGIMQWQDNDAAFCMAAPGSPRPADFTSPPGSGRTLSRWRQGS